MQIGLHGRTRKIDVGRFEKERFAVMAGAGFDAEMIRDADDLKERVGRVAYLFSGARHLRMAGFDARDRGRRRRLVRRAARPACCSATWATSSAVSRCSPTRSPTTGCSSSASARPRASRSGRGRSRAPRSATPRKSPFVRVTKARKVKVKLDRKVRYELDGGDRSKVQSFKVKVEAGALRVRVPRRDPEER